MSRDSKKCFLLNAMIANALCTNHVTTFLCHVTTSFADHVISFLEPTFKNSNGRFTTLEILIVNEKSILRLTDPAAKMVAMQQHRGYHFVPYLM